MRKPRKRKITNYLSVDVFDDSESDKCPILIEDNLARKSGGEQNWLTYKEAKSLQYWLNEAVDFLERRYAEKWICSICKVTNPGYSWVCHNCGLRHVKYA